MASASRSGPRWGVCAVVSEPPQLVMAFVAHHLALGADRIFVHLDTPAPDLQARLDAIARCEVTVLTSDYWGASVHDRPPAQSGRQRVVLARVLRRADLDWVFSVDADEFLVADRRVAEQLAGLPEEVDWAFVPVAERVFDTAPDPDNIFAGLFRRSFPDRLAQEHAAIDGAAGRFLHRGAGGYPSGKPAYRPRRGIVPDIHVPKNPQALTRGRLPGMRVLHFDGLTAAHWVWKKRRTMAQQSAPKQMRPSIAAQRAAIRQAAGDAEAQEVYLAMRCLDAARLAALDGLGLIERWRIDPRDAARALFGADGLDFTVAAFDPAPIPVTPYRPAPLWWRVRRRWRRWRRRRRARP